MNPTRRSYTQFCPAARALDLIGERWTLLIVRDLLTGPRRWSDLRGSLPRLGSNLLAERLRALEEAGLVARRELPPPAARTLYELTDRGRELDAVVLSLARFGLPYLDAPTEEQPLLPHLRDEALRAMVRFEAMPGVGAALRFELDEGRYRLSVRPLEDGDGRARPFPERLVVEPLAEGDEPAADVVVRSSLAVLLFVRRGDLGWDQAEADGLIELTGDADLARTLLGPDPSPIPA